MDASCSHESTAYRGLSGCRTAAKLSSLSLVLPAFNEEGSIRQAIAQAESALRELADDYEIIVVDDGSTDQTGAIVADEADRRPSVRIVRHATRRGYGSALRSGLQAARNTWLALADADGQFDLSELGRLIFLLPDYDLVCGYRIARQDGWPRVLCSKVYNGLTTALLGVGVRDVNCGLKIFRRETALETPTTADDFFVHAELLSQARRLGRSVVEVGVTHRPREAGRSKVAFVPMWHVFTALLRHWWNVEMFPQAMATQRPSENSWSPRWVAAMTLLLALLAGVGIFSRLNYPLIDPDETRYAQIALEMYETHDFVVPKLFGKAYLDKPPLLYWATAASYTLFGVSEWTARFPNALAAFCTVLIVFLLGRRLVGDRAAWLGAAMLMLCTAFAISSRFLLMDGLLTTATTTALLSAGCAWQSRHRAAMWRFVAGVALAMGVLTKGPVAPVLFAPPMLAIAWFTRSRDLASWRTWLPLLGPSLVIALPWFLMIDARQHEFSGYFFWQHNVMRFLHAFDHQEPWWFYLPVLAIGMFPCSLLFPTVAGYLFGRDENFRRHRTVELGFIGLSALWIVTFFSISTCKLPAYILPAIPLLCLLFGKTFNDIVLCNDFSSWPRRWAAGIPGLLTVLAIGSFLPVGIADLMLGTRGAGSIALASIFISVPGLLAIAWACGRRTTIHRSWAVAVGLCLITGFYTFNRVVPEFSAWRGLSYQAARLRSKLGGLDVPVVYFGRDPMNGRFYVNQGEVVAFAGKRTDDLETFIRRRQVAIVITDRPFAENFRHHCRDVRLSAAGGRGHLFLAETSAHIAIRPRSALPASPR